MKRRFRIDLRRNFQGFLLAILGALALLVPLWPELAPERRLGVLLVATAVIELYHGLRRATVAGRRAAWAGGAITMGMAVLVMNATAIAGITAVSLVAFWFAVDGVRYAIRALGAWRSRQEVGWEAAACAGNFAVVGLLALLGTRAPLWSLTVAAALRIFGTAANVLRAEIRTAEDAAATAVLDLGLPDDPRLAAIGKRLEDEENARGSVDRAWVAVMILTLFAIHLGRMGLDRSTLGLLSPIFAVIGDLVFAQVIAYFVVFPLVLSFRFGTRPVEHRLWKWVLAAPKGGALDWRRRILLYWLEYRLRIAIRIKRASFSLPNAFGRGLQIGLPAAAIIAATTPIWGMSWYFDTENYAAGIWNSWAEARTDIWREAMVRAVDAGESAARPAGERYGVRPSGVDGDQDFSFIVIGDTGEGDPSQHILRDQLLLAALQPEVRFVVISSDVVYPTGAMKDYELRFWLPFKGVTKPVYAIPGNHDWYDALEAFAATFLEPDAARTVMRARIEADLKLTRTTDTEIEVLLREADRLQEEYGVPTGFQHGPFFQMQTESFALFAIDTGVQKRVDGAQRAWLQAGLEAARGKFKMAVLGHPLYACGVYRAAANADFQALHELLREHDVRIVMAGDTHDFEYYEEPRDGAPSMYHWVNGGGGAFLTMGAQLGDRDLMAVKNWAFYPATAPLVKKIEANNPFWKLPMWLWTKKFYAWPSAPEWLSAAFDYNRAPFFQSFVEVRVEPSARRVRILPWGTHGRLRWSDLETSEGLRPAGSAPDATVEWSISMRP